MESHGGPAAAEHGVPEPSAPSAPSAVEPINVGLRAEMPANNRPVAVAALH